MLMTTLVRIQEVMRVRDKKPRLDENNKGACEHKANGRTAGWWVSVLALWGGEIVPSTTNAASSGISPAATNQWTSTGLSHLKAASDKWKQSVWDVMCTKGSQEVGQPAPWKLWVKKFAILHKTVDQVGKIEAQFATHYRCPQILTVSLCPLYSLFNCKQLTLKMHHLGCTIPQDHDRSADITASWSELVRQEECGIVQFAWFQSALHWKFKWSTLPVKSMSATAAKSTCSVL